ncbi:MAG: homoserine dehydrogenase [Candidatus Fimivicinus sp.]|nr:homoserine dehydrogenase [Oscillospiraceae bacterium]MDY5591896.1 homoserine dehydrogenase [Candidatus Fimivicinus sp.]
MYVAVMGYGVVGSGVVELFGKNHDSIVRRSTQSEMEIRYILDLRDFPGDPNEKKFIKDFNVILQDKEVKIVVETMGGLHPAFEYVLACLRAGKSVVTSNKELVAAKGYDLLQAAEENNVNFLFEASVGGGIPIIRPISQCLAANEIDEIAGILNGTTNFILTRMIEDQMTFADALHLAQENGYAEKDPTADIEGIDACRKICILASLAFGKHVYPNGVYTEGITKIHLRDVEYIRAWGGVIKLLGRAKRLDDGRISAMVSPAVVKRHSQLAGVDDVFNAILVRGDAIGDVVFYGRGAGKMPTASAVVADVIDCAKHLKRKKLFGWGNSEEGYVADYRDMQTALYVRAQAGQPEAAVQAARDAFGDVTLLHCEDAPEDEIAFMTPWDTERALQAKLAGLSEIAPQSVIRITDY